MRISIKDCRHEDGRVKSPWMVSYRPRGGKPVRRFHETRENAEVMATQLRQIFRDEANPVDVANAIRATAGTGYSLTQLAHLGLEAIRATSSTTISPTLTFDAATKLIVRTLQNHFQGTK